MGSCRSSIKIKKDTFDVARKRMGLSKSALARKIGIDRVTIWRALLPEDHPEYIEPSNNMIASLLKLFSSYSFNDLFLISSSVTFKQHKHERWERSVSQCQNAR